MRFVNNNQMEMSCNTFETKDKFFIIKKIEALSPLLIQFDRCETFDRKSWEGGWSW